MFIDKVAPKLTKNLFFYKNICHRHRSKGNCLSINDSSGDSKW